MRGRRLNDLPHLRHHLRNLSMGRRQATMGLPPMRLDTGGDGMSWVMSHCPTCQREVWLQTLDEEVSGRWHWWCVVCKRGWSDEPTAREETR